MFHVCFTKGINKRWKCPLYGINSWESLPWWEGPPARQIVLVQATGLQVFCITWDVCHTCYTRCSVVYFLACVSGFLGKFQMLLDIGICWFLSVRHVVDSFTWPKRFAQWSCLPHVLRSRTNKYLYIDMVMNLYTIVARHARALLLPYWHVYIC